MQQATNPSAKNHKVPEPPCEFRHVVKLQLRFNDIDMMGHVNNSIYFQYLDLGKSCYFNTVAPEGINSGRVPVVIAHAECDFFSPAYISEPLEVLTAVIAISERSITMEQRIVNADTADVKCVGRSVLAGFDPVAKQSAPIDPSWARAIAVYEGRSLARQSR